MHFAGLGMLFLLGLRNSNSCYFCRVAAKAHPNLAICGTGAKALGCSWRKPLQAKPKPVFEKNVQELLQAVCN